MAKNGDNGGRKLASFSWRRRQQLASAINGNGGGKRNGMKWRSSAKIAKMWQRIKIIGEKSWRRRK
jgi:hypothetical protein